MCRKNSLQTTAALVINNEIQFQDISQFLFLGYMITCNNMVETENKTRLTAENRFYFYLRNILESSLLFRAPKLKIYTTVK